MLMPLRLMLPPSAQFLRLLFHIVVFVAAAWSATLPHAYIIPSALIRTIALLFLRLLFNIVVFVAAAWSATLPQTRCDLVW